MMLRSIDLVTSFIDPQARKTKKIRAKNPRRTKMIRTYRSLLIKRPSRNLRWLSRSSMRMIRRTSNSLFREMTL